ncbi:L,D-transpeptidase/peptidoglycan binding protein [Clostridium estertheticum]|uniref:L,D-transpeptidase family protein n=1 Tax=Clostridium estertheticum TaxID=238834 RepID=UPI001C0DF0D3|nr:peptidoglycan binding domain-containing protein [Clostridium estertheticum]MBU3218075.1 L,D-transpeptidase/peptidoglycan binding protein [Clostridium estertheticum]WAG55742.1 L,D-transpeptidase/peptidoglycan binding protein [Clostridium estertheticum]
MEIQTIKHNKPMKVRIIPISIFTLLVLYLGISLYFSNHFYFGTVINGIKASGKTVEKVDKEMSLKSKTYTLILKERNGVKEQIKATDIGFKYNANGKIQTLKDSQNSFMWIFSLFNSKDSELSGLVTYDEKLLKECFDKLSCFDNKSVIEPQNASFKYSDNGYTIVNEVNGNKVKNKPLYANVVNAILKGETIVDLETKKYYINPKYTSKSKEAINTNILLNKYVASKITYTFTGGKEVLDGSIIHNWLGVNETLSITFDKNKMDTYVKKLDDNYNTVGKERKFATSVGTTGTVSDGDYGWLVNRTGEIADLIVAIKAGQTITKKPQYTQTAVSHDVNDIGNTYVEINLTRQHLWFYKNGSLIVEGAVVTGGVSNHHQTPTGVYSLKDKLSNFVLRGPGYTVPVAVFMPFNYGIGIHDLGRKVFGGNEYLTNGSHGCINCPPSLAKTIYNNIDTKTPIICYKD